MGKRKMKPILILTLLLVTCHVSAKELMGARLITEENSVGSDAPDKEELENYFKSHKLKEEKCYRINSDVVYCLDGDDYYRYSNSAQL